jgi:hypothetical protein
MGLTYGGGVGAMLREQATRIAACSLKFFWEEDGADGWTKGGFVRSGLGVGFREWGMSLAIVDSARSYEVLSRVVDGWLITRRFFRG